MRYKIIQKNKHFKDVYFQVADENGNVAGDVTITAKGITYKRFATVRALGKTIRLNEIRRIKAIFNNPYKEITKRPFNSFDISGDSGNGRIFQNLIQLPNSLSGYYADTMCIGSELYTVYKASFGTDGIKAAAYKGNMRICNFHIPYKIVNDEYNFDLEMYDDAMLLEAVTLVIYWYMDKFYSASQTIKSVSVSNVVSQNEFLLDKVN